MDTIKIPDQFTKSTEQEVHIINYGHSQKLNRHKISFDYYTISFLVEGIKEVYTQCGNKTIQPFNFLIVKRGNCLMTETLSDDANYKSKMLMFSREFLQYFVKKHHIRYKNAIQDTENLFQIFPFDNYIKIFVESISHISLSKDLQLIKAEELLLYLYSKFGNELFSFLRDKYTYTNVKQVVEKHITENLSVEELAFLCNMSISTFKRSFYETYKSTPYKWIRQRRLELSKSELSNSKVRASDVYLKYGFGSLSRYISAFKETYGITPKQFQQSLK